MLLAALAAGLALAACTRVGDFGRPVHHPADPGFYQQVGEHLDGILSERGQRFPYADDERELRARAWRFIERDENVPAAERLLNRFRAAPGAADGTPPDATLYYAGITRPSSRSAASLWGRLVSDMRADLETIGPLAETAFRVADTDRQRLRRLAVMHDIRPADRKTVEARIADNRETIAQAHRAALERLAGYGYALRKGGVDLPDLREAEARSVHAALTERTGFIGEVLTVYDSASDPAAIAAASREGDRITVVPAPPIVDRDLSR